MKIKFITNGNYYGLEKVVGKIFDVPDCDITIHDEYVRLKGAFLYSISYRDVFTNDVWYIFRTAGSSFECEVEVESIEKPEFKSFGKIPRLNRECIITEKIDGTNAQICITEDGQFLTGSRNRWITPDDDNHGFSKWAHENKEELLKLGVGHHYGEWFGYKINRGYGLKDRRFYLFNVSRWADDTVRPKCCGVVPVLYQGLFTTESCKEALDVLRAYGSIAVEEFSRPEGIVVFHVGSGSYFKATIENDGLPKGKVVEK